MELSEKLYYACIKEIDNLGKIAFKGVVEEIITKNKKQGLKVICLKDVRTYIKGCLKWKFQKLGEGVIIVWKKILRSQLLLILKMGYREGFVISALKN